MIKFNKLFNSKLVSLTVCIVFLCNSILYALPSTLRVPIGEDATYQRMKDVIRTKLEIIWENNLYAKLRQPMDKLLHIEEVARLFQDGSSKIFITIDPLMVEYINIEFFYTEHGLSVRLSIRPDFVRLNPKIQKILLKHEGYHFRYYDPKTEAEFRELVQRANMAYSLASSPEEQFSAKLVLSVIDVLDHVDLYRKMIKGGDLDGLCEYIYYKLGELDSTNIPRGANYKNIFNFSVMYTLYAISFVLEGKEENGSRIEKKLRKIFQRRGYLNSEMNTGRELAKQIIAQIEKERAFPRLESIRRALGFNNVKSLYFSL